MDVKKCTSCLETKPLSDFYKYNATPSGNICYKSKCKSCYNEHRNELQNTDWLRRLRHAAKKRYKETDIDKTFLQELWDKQNGLCYWLNIPMNDKVFLLQPSLDRLDSSIGYLKNNVVLSTTFANLGRNKASIEEMKEFLNYWKTNYEEEIRT
jgi:hypothetical protein